MKCYFVVTFLIAHLLAVSQPPEVTRIHPGSKIELIVLQPTENQIDSLPEMVVVPDTSNLYRQAMTAVNGSFMGQIIRIYQIAQQYLKNKGEIIEIEPAYLALTENQGGYARKGFVITSENKQQKKEDVFYIDLTKDRISAELGKLMSITQLFPHEMGHVLYRLMSSTGQTHQSNNVNVHFFSVITDYSIAFNEGFAEHIENVARLFENNQQLKEEIFADIKVVEEKSMPYLSAYERDYKLPFRLGFYKSAMIMWYQNFEDLKRYKQAMNGEIRYKPKTLEKGNVKDRISFRNAGVFINKEKPRNLVQMLANEGMVNAFFTHLSNSHLAHRYQPVEFYNQFLKDTTLEFSPSEIFSPIQNIFIKYLIVMDNYVKVEVSDKSQLNDFIDGYIATFPDEKDDVLKIFKEVTGIDYTNNLPPPLWLMVKNYQHRFISLDQVDALTIPVYTFDLNAAEIEDLLTLGIAEKEAGKVIDFRADNGFFQDLNDINKIESLNEQTKGAILDASFDQGYFDNLKDPELDIKSLIITPLLVLLKKGFIYFIPLFILLHIKGISPGETKLRNSIGLFGRYFPLWILFILFGLISVLVSGNHFVIFVPLAIVIMLIAALLFRRNRVRLYRTLVITFLMGLIICYSIW